MTCQGKSLIKHTVVLLGCDNWHCYIVYDTDISIIPPHTYTVREYQDPLFLPRDLDNWSFYTELYNVLNFKGNLRFIVACLPHQSVVILCLCERPDRHLFNCKKPTSFLCTYYVYAYFNVQKHL